MGVKNLPSLCLPARHFSCSLPARGSRKGAVPMMASGGQKLPAFPREPPESCRSTHRCQPLAPSPTHRDGTDGPLVPSLLSPSMAPALSDSQAAGAPPAGQTLEMGAPTLGKA